MGSNHHATAIAVGDRGVLVRGPSGSGKTTLGLALMRWAIGAGRPAFLVVDDQVLLARTADGLVATAPGSIAGLVEVRGRGPQPVRHRAASIIHLVVDLVEAAEAPRFAEDRTVSVEGCSLPLLVLPARDAEGAFAALASWLGLPPFDRLGDREA